jgi:hypothetical protein
MDMGARIIIGAVLLVVGFAVPMNAAWQTVVFVVAAIALVTAAIRYCPANALLGFNTCTQKREPHKAGG